MRSKNKKKIIVIFSVLIFSIGLIGFISKDNIIARYESYNYKKNLSASRQDAWDKLKVKNVTITQRRTGTAPFTSQASGPGGFDSNDSDNYVRANDYVYYNVDITIAPNTDHPGVNSNSKIKGGVIKVKVKDEYVDGIILYNMYRANWATSIDTSADNRIMTMYYLLDQTKPITNATQNLTFEVGIKGVTGTISTAKKPTIEVWMEGNKPDDPSSKANSITLTDPKPLIVTGGYDGDFDTFFDYYKEETKNTNGIYGQQIRGRIVNGTLAPDGSKTGKGIASLHKLKMKFKFKFEYKEKNSNQWELLSRSTPGSSEFYNNINFKQREGQTINRISDNEFTLSMQDGETFYTQNEGVDMAEAWFTIDIFLPYFRGATGEYQYRFTLYLESANYNLGNESRTTYLGMGSDGTINDKKKYNNDAEENFDNLPPEKPRYEFEIEPGGDINSKYEHRGNSGLYQVHWANTIVKGDEFIAMVEHSNIKGIYSGGTEFLVSFNPDYFELYKKPNGNKYFDRLYSKDGMYSREKRQLANNKNCWLEFGIYKSNRNGLYNDSQIETAVHTDFNWYKTYEEASRYGRVTAVNIVDKNPDAQNKNGYAVYFRALDKDSNVDKATLMRCKELAYSYTNSKQTGKGVYYGFGLNTYNSTYRYYPAKYAPNTFEFTPSRWDNPEDSSYKKEQYANFTAETILISKVRTFAKITTYSKDNYERWNPDVRDGVAAILITPIAKTYSNHKYDGQLLGPTTIELTFPPDLEYVQDGSNFKPTSVRKTSDGSTKVQWVVNNLRINKAIPYNDRIKAFFKLKPGLKDGAFYEVSVTVSCNEDHSEITRLRTSNQYMHITNLYSNYISKIANTDGIDANDSFIVNTFIGNAGGSNISNIKILEVLPKNGDANKNKFSGNYTIQLDKKMPGQVTYYTTNPINNIGITKDANGVDNIKNVSLPGDSRWIRLNSNTVPQNATALAITANNIAPTAMPNYSYKVTTSGNTAGDIYKFNSTLASNMGTALTSSEPVVQVTNRRIAGRIFIDDNNNNHYEYGEKYPSNVTINLYEENGKFVKTLTTSNGYYVFDNLKKGKYKVGALYLEGYDLVTPNVGDYVGSSKFNSDYKTGIIDLSNEGAQLYYEESDINLGLKVKKFNLKIKHLEEGTGKALVTEENRTLDYGTSYDTKAANVGIKYKLVKTPDNAKGTIKNNTEVIYYYKVKEFKITTHHYLENTTTKIHEDVVLTKKYDETYTVSPITDSKYEIVKRPTTESGKATNNVEVTYYYRVKNLNLTVHHYLENSTTKLVPDETKTQKYNMAYETQANQELLKNYDLVATPNNAKGTLTTNTTVTYYYRLKNAKITVHHYIEGTEKSVAPDVVIDKKHLENYTTTKATDTLDKNYELSKTPDNATGKVTGPTTVIYYYKLKTATITVNHLEEKTNKVVGTQETFTKKYTEQYSTTPSSSLDKNYELSKTPNNANGVVSGNTTVNYYYKLRSAVITVKYLEQGTDKPLAEEVKLTKKWTEKYETSSSSSVSSNYELVETPSDTKGTVSGNKTIIYYYKLKTATITVNHYKEGSTEKLAGTVTFTKNYTDKYTTSVSNNVSSNYELVAEPTNKYGTVSGNITVNYYYRLKTATIKVRFLESGTNKPLAEEITFTKKYTETYIVTPSDKVSQNYEIVTRPTETGVVKGDVTLTYYYKLKGGSLTVHHYLENSTTKLSSDENQALKWGETYKTNVNKSLLNNYELVAEPKNASGTIANDKVEVIYYYRHRIGTITVKYLETGTDKVLATETKISKNYGDTYKVNPSDKVSNNYELVERPTESGIVKGDLTLIYYYKIKKAKITVHHYIENSTTELAATEENIMSWGETYNTNASNKINKNYELVSEPKDKTGTVAGDKVINYYYKLKDATVTVKYLETKTNKPLTDNVVINTKWGKKYTTSPSSKVGPAYELISTPTNYEGTVESNSIEVIYYYQKKDSSLTGTLEFTATPKIDSVNKSVTYKYTFKGNITDFYGYQKDYKTEITFPYDIDKEKTKLPTGWIYVDNRTISSEIGEVKDPIAGALAPDGKDKFHIGDELEIYFVGIKPTDREITASIKATVTLEGGKSLTKSAPVKTAVEVKGKIIIHHYLDGTTGKVVEDIETTDLVGNNYISKPITKKGYLLVKKPEVEDLTYTVETQEVIYEYKRISLQIKTSHIGDGSITGDEEVLFGNSSTKDKIVIKPNPGFEVGEITINGEVINKECKKGCVLGAFDEVIEDKNIKVTFIKEPIIENPETSGVITPIAIITFTGIAAGSVYVYRKYKLKNPEINKL